MSDETAKLVLEHLRHIRAVQDQHTREFADMKLRFAAMEQHLAGFQLAELRQNSEIDRMKSRLEQIEKRLELVSGD